MGSLSFGEILTILVIILIIFGPKRLPEFARKVGELIAWGRKSMREFTESVEGEIGEGMQPLSDLKREFDGARNDLTGAINSIAGSGTPQTTSPSGASDDTDVPTSDTDEDAEVHSGEVTPGENGPSADGAGEEGADDPAKPQSPAERETPSDETPPSDTA